MRRNSPVQCRNALTKIQKRGNVDVVCLPSPMEGMDDSNFQIFTELSVLPQVERVLRNLMLVLFKYIILVF